MSRLDRLICANALILCTCRRKGISGLDRVYWPSWLDECLKKEVVGVGTFIILKMGIFNGGYLGAT